MNAMRAINFSKAWNLSARIFQALENSTRLFPSLGKISAKSSNPWKNRWSDFPILDGHDISRSAPEAALRRRYQRHSFNLAPFVARPPGRSFRLLSCPQSLETAASKQATPGKP
jgi:hypothetical protein